MNSPRSHALRGNAYRDAPASRDAERHPLHSHVERGNEKKEPSDIYYDNQTN